MSKVKVEDCDYEYEEEEYENECDGTCEEMCEICVYREEREEMMLEERVTDCMVDIRKCMDDRYIQIGKKISGFDIINLIKKIK